MHIKKKSRHELEKGARVWGRIAGILGTGNKRGERRGMYMWIKGSSRVFGALRVARHGAELGQIEGNCSVVDRPTP